MQQLTAWGIRLTYNLLFCLLLPLLLYRLHTSGSAGKGFAGRWLEHFGWVPPLQAAKSIWIHAASVGEVLAAAPLIKALKQQRPDLTLVLTTTTRTGADQAETLAAWATHRYAPLDCPWMVKAFVRRIKPQALLIIETERWLNYMLVCQRHTIPVAVVNGRLSPRSFKRYQHFKAFFRVWSQPLARLLVQEQEDARRFKQLGIAEEKCVLTGSIKFDIEFPAHVSEQGQQLREVLGLQRPVWMAASTHQGEEQQVLQAFRQVLTTLPHSLLILVPRHPQRFEEVANLLAQQGFNTVRRTANSSVTSVTQVYLGDTMGELPMLLAAADVTFVGGSLVTVGGHNLLEPAALGKPCLTGPHYFNFSDITRQLVNSGGARLVENATALATAVTQLLQDPVQCQRMGEAAKAVVKRNRGALQKTLQAIQALLPA